MNTNTSKKGRSRFLIEPEPLNGFRDFYPDDVVRRNYFVDTCKTISKRYNYQEYDGPVMEEQNLYEVKSSSDILDEMFAFETKKKEKVALRPEITPSLVRMIMRRKFALPLRWFSMPLCWRNETVSKGRLREYYQYNVDLVGGEGFMAEVEVISMAIDVLKQFGLGEDVVVKINNRETLEEILVGVKDFNAVCAVLDKAKKLSKAELSAQLEAIGEDQRILGMLDTFIGVKNPKDLPECATKPYLVALWDCARLCGIDAFLEFDITTIRGLAYYTGTVFEIFDRKGEYRAIAGGGRYDKLFEAYGGASVKCCGFGMGDCVVMEMLKDLGKLPVVKREVDWLMLVEKDLVYVGFGLCNKLRSRNESVEMKMIKNLSRDLNYSSSVGAKRIVLLLEREVGEGYAVVKIASEGKSPGTKVKIEDI